MKWLVVIALALLTFNVCRRYGWLWIIHAIVAAGIAQAIIGLYTFFGGSGADHLVINARLFRAFGTFGQPNPFGGFMGLLAPLALMIAVGYAIRVWILSRHGNIKPGQMTYLLLSVMYYCAASFLLISGVFASWSRGSWLGLIVACITMAIALPRRLWQSVVLFFAIVLFGWIAWSSGFLPESITERVASASQEIFVLSDIRAVDITPENYPIVERLAHWQAATNMVRENPWIGIGFGNYAAAYADYALLNWDHPLGHAHNYYLNVLAETGIFGLAAYAVVFLSMFWSTWQARKHPDGLARSAAIGLLGTWTYIAVHSLTDNLYVNNVFIHFGVLLGLLTYINHDVQQRVRKTIA
jgi:putative inorganic carbon (HCO3(-)) transporter